MLTHLASWFPSKHFSDQASLEYFSQYVASRFHWYRALAEPYGAGTGGTIIGPATSIAVLSDVQMAVEEMVGALLWEREGFSLDDWKGEWNQAKAYIEK